MQKGKGKASLEMQFWNDHLLKLPHWRNAWNCGTFVFNQLSYACSSKLTMRTHNSSYNWIRYQGIVQRNTRMIIYHTETCFYYSGAIEFLRIFISTDDLQILQINYSSVHSLLTILIKSLSDVNLYRGWKKQQNSKWKTKTKKTRR